MRVKLFLKNEPMKPATAQDFETEINACLQQHAGIKVVDIKQSARCVIFADSLWLISVWYEEAA